MDARATFFLGNRIWWAGALLLGPVLGAVAGDAIVALVATPLLILPTFLIFDTDRPWWPDAVRQLSADSERSRVEVRKLTLWSAGGLLTGLVIALVRPWS